MISKKKLCPFVAVIMVILIGVLGFILVGNPGSLNMDKNFVPQSIEIDIDGGMKNIEFTGEDSSKVLELLQYDTWEKAKMEYDLATMTYLSNGFNKVIGLYEDVDGYTFIEFYSGFGIRNGFFYKAPQEIYNNIENFLIHQYVK